MDEPALSFEGVTLSPQKEVVRVFYKEMWDHADKSLIPQIFHKGFGFHGSLGLTLTRYDEFNGFVDWVTGALGRYTTDILSLIEEGNRVSGKMRFHGFHRKELFAALAAGKAGDAGHVFLYYLNVIRHGRSPSEKNQKKYGWSIIFQTICL